MKRFQPEIPATGLFYKNSKCLMVTSMADSDEYAIYKRSGNVFILVDSFSDFNQANEEAKEMIRQSGKFTGIFASNQNS